MSKLQELKLQREHLIEWMDMCDANFSVNANEKLYKIEQEIKKEGDLERWLDLLAKQWVQKCMWFDSTSFL